ncbi:hypothetical protein EON65_11610, partial [archaeon]
MIRVVNVLFVAFFAVYFATRVHPTQERESVDPHVSKASSTGQHMKNKAGEAYQDTAAKYNDLVGDYEAKDVHEMERDRYKVRNAAETVDKAKLGTHEAGEIAKPMFEQTGEKLKEWTGSAQDTASDMAEGVQNRATNLAEQARQGASHAQQRAQDTYDATKQKASQAYDATKQKAGQAYDATKHTAQDMVGRAQDSYDAT